MLLHALSTPLTLTIDSVHAAVVVAAVVQKSEFHAAHVDPFVLVSLQGFKMGANRLLDALAQKSLPPYNSAIADVKSFLDQAFSLAIANYTAAL